MTALAPDRRTAVVALTHDPKLDDPALDVALRSEAFYIAALGSRRTHAGRLERLQALGHDAGDAGPHPRARRPRHRRGEPGRDRDLGDGRDDPGATRPGLSCFQQGEARQWPLGKPAELADDAVAVALVERAGLEVVGLQPERPGRLAAHGLCSRPSAAVACRARRRGMPAPARAARRTGSRGRSRRRGRHQPSAVVRKDAQALESRPVPMKGRLKATSSARHGLRHRPRLGSVGQLDRRRANSHGAHAAGCPSVMPWSPPPPCDDPPARRPARSPARPRPPRCALAAALSAASPKPGTITAPLAR